MKYYKRFTKTPGNLLTFARQNHWISEALLVICLLLFALTLNVSRAVRADYNHDEDQFITSARLQLDEGMLPYLDYPYFHTPYLVFVYAGLFALTGNYNLLAARLFFSS